MSNLTKTDLDKEETISSKPLSYRTVIKLAGPNILSNILMVSVSFAQLVIIAPYGATASAAVVTGGRIQFFLLAMSLALSVATTAIVARHWGANDKEAAARATTASVTMAVIIGSILAITAYLTADQSVALFGLDRVTESLAADYVRATSLINLIPCLFIVLTAAFRAIGQVVMPMWITAIGTSLSILVSYLFVRDVFGIGFTGPVGLVWGVAIGQGISVLLLLWRWLGSQSLLAPRSGGWTDRQIMRSLLKIGSPAALEQLLIQASFILFMILIAKYGTEAFAAYGIGITILSVTIVVGLGFGTASSALTGQSLGAGDISRAKESGWAAMRLAIYSMSVLAVITILFREPIAALMTVDTAVQNYTVSFVWVLAAIQPLMAIEFALGGALRGAGDTRFPLFVSFSGNLGARFTFGYLVYSLGLPVEYLYSVIFGDYIVKGSLLIWRFKGNAWTSTEGSKEPSALPSLAGISRAALRAFYTGQDRR